MGLKLAEHVRRAEGLVGAVLQGGGGGLEEDGAVVGDAEADGEEGGVDVNDDDARGDGGDGPAFVGEGVAAQLRGEGRGEGGGGTLTQERVVR